LKSHLLEINLFTGSTLRKNEKAFRIGGDEFIIFIPNVETSEGLEVFVERIIEEILKLLTIENQVAQAGVSIGIALCGEIHNTLDGLLRAADELMYVVKN
jgi:diguanylate cyclase (GGDEF)-like protein